MSSISSSTGGSTSDPMQEERPDAVAAGPPLPLQLYQLTTGAWVTQAISVMARLGVADVLTDEPLACDDVATTVGADAQTLYRLLRALTDLGLVCESPGRKFVLTPLGRLLRSDEPHSMRGWATMMSARFYRDAWGDLERSVRTGEPSFARVHGTDLFGHLADHPDDAAVFDAAMRNISTNFLAGILVAYDFAPFATIIDVGGGTGALLTAILRAAPTASGILFDTQQVLAQAPSVLAEAGVEGRCRAVAGDFFETVPDGGDLYILSNIVHDWNDEAAVRILRTCREAMRPTARLLIIELVLPDGNEPSMAKLLDLEMLSVTPNGRQRTTSEYRSLLTGAGFATTQVVPAVAGAPASFVEATPLVA